MNDLKVQFSKYVKDAWYVPLLIGLGIVLMVMPGKKVESAAVAAATTEQAYAEELEQKICLMLQEIEGAKDCSVTVTLTSGIGKEYVRENGNVLVITDTDGNQIPVVSRETMPEIAGVTVVCNTMPDVTIQNDIVRSVSTLLGIGTNKVCVLFYGEE